MDRRFNTYFTCGNAVILHVSAFFSHPQGGIQKRDIPQRLVKMFVISVFIYAFVIVNNFRLLSFSLLNTYQRMAETCSRITTYLYTTVHNYSAVVLVLCDVILASC